jgi:hypothetical protein
MNLFALVVLAGTLLSQVNSPGPPAAPNFSSIFVPRGVVIPVTVTKDVRVGGSTSASQQTGKIRFEVTQDVVVDGYVIVKAGDLVEGHYTTATNVTHRTFSTDSSQEVILDLDDAVNFCGDTLHLNFERTFVGGTRSGFLSFGVHSHDAVFTKGLVLRANTDRGEKSICASPATGPSKALPSNMVLPDNELASPKPPN